jgi:hypothetical protein
VLRQNKIFLLINELSTNKKVFYDAFAEVLEQPVTIDFYVYNSNFTLFKKLLNGRRDGYTHYVILPQFDEGGEKVNELLSTLPKDKLILLDKPLTDVNGGCGAVYLDFKKKVYTSLEKILEPLSKYHTLNLVLSKNAPHATDIAGSFNSFCLQYAFERNVLNTTNKLEIKAGEVYICASDDELIALIEKVKNTNLKVGKDVGIISCNETPLKKYILNGITTLSLDYGQMGRQAAKMILNDNLERVELDCQVNLRSSL